MNLRTMDAVFPIRERKSVNRIESFNELGPKETNEFRSIGAVPKFTCWFKF